jgi:hypothetical protein
MSRRPRVLIAAGFVGPELETLGLDGEVFVTARRPLRSTESGA